MTQTTEAAKPASAQRWIKQIPPPLDLKTPLEDAAKPASGLVYKKLIGKEAGRPAPTRRYSG